MSAIYRQQLRRNWLHFMQATCVQGKIHRRKMAVYGFGSIISSELFCLIDYVETKREAECGLERMGRAGPTPFSGGLAVKACTRAETERCVQYDGARDKKISHLTQREKKTTRREDPANWSEYGCLTENGGNERIRVKTWYNNNNFAWNLSFFIGGRA